MKALATLLLLSGMVAAQASTPSWVASINFDSILKQLDANSPMAHVVRAHHTIWAQRAETAGQLHGGEIVNHTPIEFDIYTNAKFLDVLLHLGGDSEQTLRIHADGSWYLRDKKQMLLHGTGARP